MKIRTFFLVTRLYCYLTCNFTPVFSGSTDCLQHLGGACTLQKKVKDLEDENLKLRLEVCLQASVELDFHLAIFCYFTLV